jgi:hypothetical protein
MHIELLKPHTHAGKRLSVVIALIWSTPAPVG